jgi:glycosyltransferase involved in cell wall biosynthesis/predicted Zn-dependent protease
MTTQAAGSLGESFGGTHPPAETGRPAPDELFQKYESMFARTEGWLLWEAVQILRFLSDAQAAEGVVGNFAEIGAYQGKLSLAMATFLNPEKELLLVNDIFDQQDLNTSRSGVGATFAAFRDNFFHLDPNPHYVRVFRKRSDQLAPGELGNGIRFFSVDGGHSCEETCHDLRLAAQTIHPHGMIVLDDYYNTDWPGVAAGVSAYFQAQTDLVPLAAFYNKFVFVKREARTWFHRLLAVHGFEAFCREHGWDTLRGALHGFEFHTLRGRPPISPVVSPHGSAAAPAANAPNGQSSPNFNAGDPAANFIRIAEAHLARKNFKASCDTLLWALNLKPNDPEILTLLGTVHFDAGDFPAACRVFRQAIEADPKSARLPAQLAAACLKAGDAAAAQTALAQAFALDSHCPEALRLQTALQDGSTGNPGANGGHQDSSISHPPHRSTLQEIVRRTPMTPNPLPKISITIPSFNQGQYIEDTITSILDQGYPELEIFVFDGGSTDATVDVLKKYARHLTHWVSEKDQGQTDAINKGLRRATGQVLAYLNSDDFFLPRALHCVGQAYQAHPDAGLYTGNGLVVDGRKEHARLYMHQIGYSYESLLRGSCYLLQPSTFINRKAWEKAGEFDPSLRFAMDLDYWLRVGRDFEVVLLNEPLSAWRMHEDIKTANGGMVRWNELWRVYRKYTPDQLTPGLLVEFFSVLQSPLISQQLGLDVRALAGQCFKTLYAEMQKTLKLSDCVPVGQGNIFKPVPPPAPAAVFRAYPPPLRPIAAPAAMPAAAPAPVAPPASPARPRVDIVLQATGVHAWAVGGGWENAARQLGVHHRTFRPRANWGDLDAAHDDGLFAYLAQPQADFLLLAGFDWHSQPLHASPRWREQWAKCPARKILYVQESVLNHEKLSGSKVMEQAFRSAAALVDAILYTDLADRPLMESAGKPALFQPFGVDDTIFSSRTPFAGRIPRAFFRGKHQPFAGQAASYQDRRALIQHLLDHQALDLVPYQERPVTPQDLATDFNRYQVAVNFPSVFANHPTRIYEAMACGCAVVTNRTGLPEVDRQFESGRHLLYYSNPEEMLQAVRRLAADPALAAQIAAQGQKEALEQHALHRRLAEALAWLGAISTVRPPAAAPAAIPGPAAARRTILIDGAIFDLQRDRPHGISRVWTRLLEQLARSPLAGDIVLLDRDGAAPAIPGIRRRTVAAYDHQRFESDSLWLQRWCDEENAALLISTYFTYAETTPTVVMIHDMIPELTGQKWRGKALALRKSIGYFAVSQSTINDFHRLHPELADRPVFLMPNAVGDDLQPVAPEGVRAFRQKFNLPRPYFLLVGHRADYKNAALFFRAFAQMPGRERFDIVCVGGGSKLEPELEALRQGATVHLMRVGDEALSAAYSGAVALVYASRYEGFGLPILEAQKCGCPVITCRNSSLAEVGGDSVLYVGEADEAALRQALLDVQRPEVRQTLLAAGAKNLPRFSWSATGDILARGLEEFRSQAAALPPRSRDPLDTLRRLIFALDEGDAAARQLAVPLRTIVWQYQDFENYDRQRLGAAEAAAATLLNAGEPPALRALAPLKELDGLTALVLGLAAELRKDWRRAWDCYHQALSQFVGPVFNFRVAVRLAQIAEHAGEKAAAESVRDKLIPKAQGFLDPRLDVATEIAAVRDWPANVETPAPAPRPADPAGAPLVTAIVSTFKSERFIRGCLEDLEAQTIADRLEIIVVDSHSPQNERAVVEEFQKRYSNIVYIRTQERETVYGAWNRGARAARGKYLTNANTDDRHRADALEILARTLDEHPDASLAYADCLVTCFENETFETANPISVFRWLEFNPKDLWEKGCYCGPQPMWRREVHAQDGYFDAQMVSAGDYEFWLRLAQTRQFQHVPITLGLYLRSPTSVEHANGAVGSKEVQLARQRYGDAIMAGKSPFRPVLPDPTAAVEVRIDGASPAVAATPVVPAVPAVLAAPAAAQVPVAPVTPVVSKPLPAVALLGQLNEARELFARQDHAAAWEEVRTALARRPFHPEAYLLLAEIALAAGDGKSAKRCAQVARDLAPGWDAARQFLNRPLKGQVKPAWLRLSALPSAAAAPAKGSGHSLVRFEGKKEPNYGLTPTVAPAAAPSLSVCLIVKNEGQFLAQCLKSIRGLGAQLIVVDTGSTDRTVEIAREFGAEIYSFAWCDDFSAARNAALEHATGDWILMLDADEELPAAQHEDLRADMRNAAAIAFRLPLVNVGKEDEGRSFVPRLFRNAPRVCFTGRIHEQVFASLLVHAKKWGLKTAFGSAELLHHGYTPELLQGRNKIARNLKLLQVAVAESPADVNLLMNLGLELVRSDDLAGGVEKYRQAYALMAAQPAGDVVPELREVLLTQLTSQLYKLHAYAEIVARLTSPLAEQRPLTASLHFALGLAYFELKQFGEAADQMRQCLAQRKQPCLTPINTDVLTAAPQHCLALCLAGLGDPAAAEQAFVAAVAEAGREEAAKLDYATFLRNASRPVDALHQLHDVTAANPRQFAAWRQGGEIALSRPDLVAFALEWTTAAFTALPENPVIAALHAEALMLNDQPAEAAGLWANLWRSEHDPRILAALILCQAAADKPLPAINPGPDEQATSSAFVQWYQKLIAARAKPMLEKINGRLEPLSHSLPSAAQRLRSALSQAAGTQA